MSFKKGGSLDKWTPIWVDRRIQMRWDNNGRVAPYVSNIIFKNNSAHEARIEMDTRMSEILGVPTSFSLRGGSIKGELSTRDETQEKFLNWKMEGLYRELDMINTIFPRFLAITSPVCRYGMIGRKMERVLAIIECDENIKDGIIL